MKYPTPNELRELSEEDRLRLIEDLWDTFVTDPRSLPLSEEHQQEIDRRLESLRREPAAGKSWPDVRAGITKR